MKAKPARSASRVGNRSSAPAIEQSLLERRSTAAKRILLVDDDAALRRLCARVLEGAGHKVDCAAGAAAGVALFERAPYDIVITDIVMPAMDGTELIKRLRTAAPSAKIVAISGGSKALPAETGLRLGRAFGVDAVLYKPFRPDELLETIGAL